MLRPDDAVLRVVFNKLVAYVDVLRLARRRFTRYLDNCSLVVDMQEHGNHQHHANLHQKLPQANDLARDLARSHKLRLHGG